MWEAMSHPSFNTWHAVSASENRLKWRSNWNDIVGGPEKNRLQDVSSSSERLDHDRPCAVDAMQCLAMVCST